MRRPVVAVVTGFTRNRFLLEASFAPIVVLKLQGVIDRIHYVTWDKAELDACVAPAAALPEVDIVRVPEPHVTGADHQKGFLYQSRNLAAALALVPEPEALVVKLRPDFLFDPAFLASKLLASDFLLAPVPRRTPAGVLMPPSPFKNKIWVAWADANQPFFMEDAAFIGCRSDLGKLVSEEAEKLVGTCGDADSPWITHVLRFIVPFLPEYPIFNRYLENFHFYVKDEKYRFDMLNATLLDPFFLHLLAAAAWILASSFHVDCGHARQLRFYPRQFTGDIANKPLEELPIYSPYSSVEQWRASEDPGSFLAAPKRVFGRLMDDSWQTALFSGMALKDIGREEFHLLLQRIADYRSGRLAGIEKNYYALLKSVYLCRKNRQAA